ncbi:15733_t:CDS:2, partial [Funneliformis mosseae]
ILISPSELELNQEQDITILKTVLIMKKSINKRIRYGKLWGIAREATLFALDFDDHEMKYLLQDYINRKKGQSESISINTQTEISTLPSIEEHKEPILFTNKTEQMDINDNTESITKKLELQNIQNPLKTKTKGRPPTKRYKSSVEIEQGNSRNTK